MLDVEISIRNKDAAKVTLTNAADFTRNPLEANKEMGIWLFRWVDKNIRSEGRSVGGWPPFKYGGRIVSRTKKNSRTGKRTRNKLATSQSVVNRRFVDAGAALLQDTGFLRASFDVFYTRRTAGIGSSVEYAPAHEHGNPKKNLPQRRMLPRNTDTEVSDMMIKIYKRHATEAINK